MESTDEQHQGTCQGAERSPNLTINRLPDEVLLEIFDFYRRGIDRYDLHWREKYVWFNLTGVCRKWRAIMLASSSRLDLCVTVGPEKPGHIKTILSGPFPIFVNYIDMHRDITGSALWRMRAALKHHRDRVREIDFSGPRANFDKFFEVTNCTFPGLESLFLQFKFKDEPELPDTFLRGPDLSDLHLRRLKMYDVTLASISGLLLSATALTDLSLLLLDTASSPSPETSLLACIQGMPCLRSLDLFISSDGEPQLPPKDIVPLSNLTLFRFGEYSAFLDALVAGISAPSLRVFEIELLVIQPSIVHLPRFINEMEEYYYAAHVTFQESEFRLSLQTQSEHTSHCELCINSHAARRSLDSVMQLSRALSTKLAAVEELRVTINKTESFFSWGWFYHQCPNVKVIRTGGVRNNPVVRTLHQVHGEPDDLAFLPALEEIDLGEDPYYYESDRASQLAAFQPFVSARQQAGRPVKVFFHP